MKMNELLEILKNDIYCYYVKRVTSIAVGHTFEVLDVEVKRLKGDKLAKIKDYILVITPENEYRFCITFNMKRVDGDIVLI